MSRLPCANAAWLTCHRGAGIGHALLRSLVQEADAAGRDVYLTTLQSTERFYKAERFSKVPTAAIPRCKQRGAPGSCSPAS